MTNTTPMKPRKLRALAAALVLASGLMMAPGYASQTRAAPHAMTHEHPTAEMLSAKQQAIPLIAASMAKSDMPGLRSALNQGLDAGLAIGEAKEILVQLYAYVGFPRSLNALGELKSVVEERRKRGRHDAPGREPSCGRGSARVVSTA